MSWTSQASPCRTDVPNFHLIMELPSPPPSRLPPCLVETLGTQAREREQIPSHWQLISWFRTINKYWEFVTCPQMIRKKGRVPQVWSEQHSAVWTRHNKVLETTQKMQHPPPDLVFLICLLMGRYKREEWNHLTASGLGCSHLARLEVCDVRGIWKDQSTGEGSDGSGNDLDTAKCFSSLNKGIS